MLSSTDRALVGSAVVAFLLGATGCGPDEAPPREPPAVATEAPAGPDTSPVPPADPPEALLRAALASDSAKERRAAAQGLAERAELSVEAVGPLTRTLADENRWVREWSARALARLGPEAAPAVDALIVCLHDPDSFVRWRAAEALGAIGPAAKAAIPLLREAAESTDETEIGRSSAQDALRSIEVE